MQLTQEKNGERTCVRGGRMTDEKIFLHLQQQRTHHKRVPRTIGRGRVSTSGEISSLELPAVVKKCERRRRSGG